MTSSKSGGGFSFRAIGKTGSRVFLNKYSYLFLFCVACAISVAGWEVYGALAFVGLICLSLIFCDDIMAAALPLLLLCVFVTNCYDSADTFLKYAWMAIPAALSIIFHFVFYRQRIVIGKSIWGLIAVSLAVTLGGLGVITAEEYFSPVAIYYTVFLGVGMVALYILLKSQLSAARDYDLLERAVTFLYIMGIFAAFVVLYNVLPDTKFAGGFTLVENFQPSNNLSTVLMFAMPCTFYFARKNPLHIVSALVMASSMVLSGSRSGIIFAVVEFILCIVVSAIFHKERRFTYICVIIGIAVVIAIFRQNIMSVIESSGIYPVIDGGETRMKLIDRAVEYYKKYPLFGHGLAYTGNFDIYSPKKGAMGWYHMMIPQIVASMGSVGIIAYLYQGVVQARVFFGAMRRSRADRKTRALTVTLVLSYVGVLMMSQVNPGIFCPIPYGLMATVIFALIDGDREIERVSRMLKKDK